MAIIELSCEGVLSAGDHNEINKGSWFVGFCNAHADIKTTTKQWAIGYISKWKVYFKMFPLCFPCPISVFMPLNLCQPSDNRVF